MYLTFRQCTVVSFLPELYNVRYIFKFAERMRIIQRMMGNLDALLSILKEY